MDKDVDICLVQETFLCQGDTAKLKEIKDLSWQIKSDPRKHRSGGGIATLSKHAVKLKYNDKVKKYKSFQVMESLITTKDELLRLINVYRPGYSKKARHTECIFLEEFDDYLTDLSEKQGTPILMGDFNIHVERDGHYSSKFLSLLEGFGLVQCCPLVPTHELGGTIDLVITTPEMKERLGPISVDESVTGTDHYLVSFNLAVNLHENAKKDREISYRKFKDIDLEEFKKDLRASELCSHQNEEVMLDEAVKLYNETLIGLMDKHCPVQVKKVKINTSPWMDEELRDLRRMRRRAERARNKIDSSENRARYRELCKKFTAS